MRSTSRSSVASIFNSRMESRYASMPDMTSEDGLNGILPTDPARLRNVAGVTMYLPAATHMLADTQYLRIHLQVSSRTHYELLLTKSLTSTQWHLVSQTK